METFEKKYNEALGWMQKIYPTLTGTNKEDAEHYFPELKEQPDPRHSLIEFIKWTCNRGYITPEQRKNVDFWLAYLEKQKSVQSDTEKQYVRTLESLISDFLHGKQEVDRDYYQQICNWLEGRHIEQQHTEWSEEDEEMIDYIIHALSNNTCVKEEGPAIYAKEINWLKSLSPQPKQEWSKEDKDKIESIKGLITTGKFVDTNTIRTIWKLLDSLHPQSHWKPSEYTLSLVKKVADGEMLTGVEQMAMGTLCEQLKKL